MENYNNGSLSKEEILQKALQAGIIDFDMLGQRVENMTREQILKNHPYKIWPNKHGLWLTYLPDKTKKYKRAFLKRKTEEELQDAVVKFYQKQKEEIYIRNVFKEWSESKLKYGEIKKQSYDRYCTDFERFFPQNLSICRKKMKNISEADLTDFIKSTIHEKKLTRKSYSGLRTLLNGIFKYGKLKGYTDISITQFFGDLELPKNIYTEKIKSKEEQIFMENEIDLVTNYLKNHVDIWNMGLLLQFQTGMRIGEISALKPEDIHADHISVQRTQIKYKDDDGKVIFAIQEVAKTKAGNRDVYFSDSVKWTLKQIENLNPHGEFLFMNKGKRILENTFNKRLNSVCEELHITPKSTHKIRRTYGTTLIDNSVNESTIAEQMGHSDISVTKNYYYYSNKSKSTKLEQLNKAINF